MTTDAASSTAPSAAAASVAARAAFMMGPEAEAWSPDEVMAWEGLVELGRGLRREAEAHIEAGHSLSVSMLGILGRLARAPERALRLTDLAGAMGLSISRISRVIDVLEERRLVERRACPTDARAIHVVLQDDGLHQAEAAQKALHQFARTHLIDRLSPDEVHVLGQVFSRLIGGCPAPTCGGEGE